MPSTAAHAAPLDPSSVRPRRAAWRDAALLASSAAAVAAAYVAARDAVPLATAAVLALSTAAAMHGRLATNRWRAAAGVLAAAALLAVFAAPPRLVGTVLISGLTAAELIARCTGRSAVLRAGAWTALVAGAASLSGVAATVSLPAAVALREALAAAGGALLAAPLLLALGPLAEWTFGHTTRLTLGEWLSYEHPLLRELATAAPGTFQHSVNVGVLADAGAAAIHADALLARAGGLYHDVGKIRAPGYFI
jgi:membrane-associated HD superfamily phosphohydrolase